MPKKFSLMDQAKELASEIEIPITRLPSRADEEVEQGREVVDKTAPESAAGRESKPAPVEEPKSATTAKPTIINRRLRLSRSRLSSPSIRSPGKVRTSSR